MTPVTINGKRYDIDLPADTPLLWALRDELGLTGTKFGCGMALCGACTVHLDGQAVRSCMTPLSAVANKKVTTIEGLEAVTTATLSITADPESERVALVSTGGEAAAGSLLFSPSTAQLVVVASGLEDPPSGQEYRCWVLVDGERVDVGRMNFSQDLAYWVGRTPSVADVPDGTTFGVSLTDLDGSGTQADPVIVGDL